jgi:hypothetical protein
MVDAWLYKLCGDAVSETDDDATFLRCYAAVDRTMWRSTEKNTRTGREALRPSRG